jgi:hypothetical protein
MLKEEIQKRIISALKRKNQTELKVLRFILSQINYAEIDKKQKLTDQDIILLMQKEMKKRLEAIEMFKKSNRTDIVMDEENQVDIIKEFLPKQLSEDEIEKIIEKVISIDENANMGMIIRKVMEETKGKADGKIIAEIVKQKLS